jgi:predicted dehydrogenase
MDRFYSRRAFVSGLGLAAVAGTRRVLGANEILEIGCIGTGGRCRGLMRALAKIPGVRLAAVCDVWDEHREAGRKLADPKAAVTSDYRALLERKDIDAVLIGTPDHWHVPIMIDACSAGKDVYVEKPLTHALSEGAAAIDAVRRSGRIVQVGMQQRSMPQFQEGREIVRSGKLGRIHKVHLTWNRNSYRGVRAPLGIDPRTVDWQKFLGAAPAQPFDEYRFRQWRWYWDFGGGILTDLMVHFIDVVHWYFDLDHPETATTLGNNFRPENRWETPDTVQALLGYPSAQLQVYFEGTFVNARNAAMLEFMGTEATLYLDRGRYEIHPERKRGADNTWLTPTVEARERVLGEGPRGADFYENPNGEVLHLQNWIDAVRSRKPPLAPVEAGVSAAAAAHLANQAYRKGQVAHWNS